MARPRLFMDVAMRQFFFSAWLSGMRGRSFHVVFLLGVALVGVAYLAGAFSPRHPTTVVLDVGYSGIRFGLLLMVLFWVQELVTNEIDRRTVFFALTYPVPRWSYLAGRFAGIAALAAVAAIVLGLLLWLAVIIQAKSYQQQFPPDLGLPYWAAIAGLWIDSVVVMAFTIFLATIATSRAFPLVLGLAFGIAAKAIGPVMEYLAEGAEGDVQLVSRFQPLLDFAVWLLPDLSRLDWRTWPMYGVVPEGQTVMLSIALAVAYAATLFIAAVIGIGRRSHA